jgi:signal transduction histidine kinase
LAATYLLASRPITGSFWVSGSGGQVARVSSGPSGSATPAPGTGAAAGGATGGAPPSSGAAGQGHFDAHLVQQATLHQLLTYSGFVLIGMAVLTLALGWLVAGRVLRPLRTITVTTRDISERNLHQRLNLPGPTDELKNLGDTIDGLLERLEGAFEAQRRFVANASHEFRTPLATMRAALDVAEAKPEPVPPQTLALAERLRGQLDELDLLLDSFLALARVQHDTTSERTLLTLDDLITDALDQRETAIADKPLAVRRHDDPRARIVGDPILLARLTANLIDNAVRHNQPGGWIEVTTTADATTARVELAVETGGPVLDQEHVRQLARPFRRLGADRTGSHNGTGLGLSIVDAIATAHGGTLQLHARPEGGLRVVVDLPLATPSVPVGAGV